MSDLRTKIIRLAYAHPKLQAHLLPILKMTGPNEGSNTRKIAGTPQLNIKLVLNSLLSDRDKLERKEKRIISLVKKILMSHQLKPEIVYLKTEMNTVVEGIVEDRTKRTQNEISDLFKEMFGIFPYLQKDGETTWVFTLGVPL